MITPGRNGHGIASFPGLCEAIECEFGCLDWGCSVEGPHIGTQWPAILPRNELGHIANVVHDAKLYVGLWEDGFHSIP
jgi:hypothetical protein